MKALVLTICLLMSACASNTPDPRITEFQQWRAGAFPMAKAGDLKWSAYYVEYYDRLLTLPASPQRTIDMQSVSELIPQARRYETGDLTKDQFDDINRAISARNQASREKANKQQQIEQAASDKEFQEKMKFKPIQSWIKPTVTCATTQYPGSYTANTTCSQ